MARLTDRPVQRALRLTAGLALFGLCLALLVEADLGADPWTVLTQGLAAVTGLTLGQVVVAVSVLLLVLWVPLRQRPGPGTVANALLVGPFLDLGLAWIPTPHHLPARVAFLVTAVVGVAVATGLYVGAGWGSGPRDGLMTGLADLGVPVVAARAAIELSVLAVGWLLGGSVGVATVVFALAIGPLVGYALGKLRLPPSAAPDGV
ncbi:putative membrane protein YczE [Streptomyces sp. V3I8]|jgi:uncharacterized membrane protein YczE|uniref:membrane protein YczE n=1 Tax=Streptomyces sp. V3I8 TaxID=3042279 RepID=UPI00277F8538|nr:hypothetical protein [Streptomyces sp. V3I8]MDQ1041259.1 putative membrane protein YczE [Streptomyces sp. V3I8]